jgi:hypothetical protein
MRRASIRIDGVPIDDFSLYKIDHLCRRITSAACGTYLRSGTFPLQRRAFISKSRMPPSEHTMNIFYIIGVIVVVVFVAGFFGLHA